MPFSKYSPKQKKLARVAKPRNKITGADLRALAKKKKKGRKKRCQDIKIKEQCLKEDTLKPAMEMGPMQGTQMQTNAFNPMPTTSQAEIFRMNPGLQQELETLMKAGIAEKRADLAFLGIDDSMMSDTEVQNYIIPPELQELLNQQPPPPEMREESFKTDRMLTEGLDEITPGMTETLDPNMMGALRTFQAGK